LVRTLATASALLAALAGCGTGRASNAAAGNLEFANLRVQDIGATSAVVLFETSVPSTCEVQFGQSLNELNNHATDPSMTPGTLVTSHRVPLLALPPATTIYFRAMATDASLRSYYSSVSNFQTLTNNADAGLVNVALTSAGTTVVDVSSNYGNAGNASTYGADNAIDGEIATEWATNGDGSRAYIVLDFGQSRAVSHFGYRSRKMADGTSIVTQVRVVATELGQNIGVFDTPDPDIAYSFDFTSAVTVRQVRVEAVDSTGGNTGAAEIEFFE